LKPAWLSFKALTSPTGPAPEINTCFFIIYSLKVVIKPQDITKNMFLKGDSQENPKRIYI
jgi:hypothetical protein